MNAAVDEKPAPTERDVTPAKNSLAMLSASSARVLAIIPSNMDQVWRMAKAIAMAGWAPKGYATNGVFDEQKIAVGIMHGMEVGFTPIAALQSIAVINGMPSIYGDGALALVLNSGLMEDFKETRVLENGKVVGYQFWAIRRGRKSPIEQQFLKSDAERAGLIGKAGPWTQYEQRMYQMRARAWGLRDGFADVLRGLAIAEEALDVTPERDVTPQPGALPLIEMPRSKSEPKAEAQAEKCGNGPEPYTNPAAPASSAPESAAPAAQSKPSVTGAENGGAAPADTSLKPSQVNVIRAKMKGQALTDLDLETAFPGKSLDPKERKDQFGAAEFSAVCEWIASRSA